MAQNFTDTPALSGEHSPLITPSKQAPVGRGPIITAVAAFLLLAVIGIAFLLPKLHHKETLQEDVRANAGPPPVAVTKVSLGQATNVLELPGTVQAFSQTPIFARTNGYITKRFVDIGDHVKAGQLLAIIQDPQTEQSLRQGEGNPLPFHPPPLPGRGKHQPSYL